jgi:hypothetical protein
MKLVEREKIQKSITRIQSGRFDENDVDLIYIKLRAYSREFKIFREMGDFVAHNDKRNQGEFSATILGTFLEFRFFTEYIYPQKELRLNDPFPEYIKNLIIYKIDTSNEADFTNLFNTSKLQAKNKVEQIFRIDKKNNITQPLSTSIDNKTIEILNHLLSTIVIKPKFTQDKVIEELIQVMRQNRIDFNEKSILQQADKIMLCSLLLIHDAEYDIGSTRKATSHLSCDNSGLPWASNVKYKNMEFGKLNINATVPAIISDKQNINFSVPILTTYLNAVEYCNQNMFAREKITSTPTYNLVFDPGSRIRIASRFTWAHGKIENKLWLKRIEK